jgi:putative heme-binding domain-containing protein
MANSLRNRLNRWKPGAAATRQARRILLLPFAVCLLPFAFSHAQESITEKQIEAGRLLYAGSCGNSYCHGSEGKGGGAPVLRDRVFRAGYLRSIIRDGSAGTPMPGFKERMSPQEINQVVAYLLSLSPGKGDKPEQALVQPPAAPAGPASEHFNQTPKTAPAANRPPQVKLSAANEGALALRGDALAGRELFFDQNYIDNCRVCHSVNGVGGKIASDLSRLRDRSAREIARAILAPQLSEVEKYGLLTLTTRGGDKFTGVKRDEDALQIRLYDTSTLPPVSRNFLKTEVAKLEKLGTLACPGGYAEKFTVKQLLDLVTFLKSADLKNPASVSLLELF